MTRAPDSEGAVANPFAYPKGDCHPGHHEFRGMTLRDWFAGQALVEVSSLIQVSNAGTYDVVATLAYELADAMLRVRHPATDEPEKGLG